MAVKLAELMDALGCSMLARRKDECGDWRVEGRFGWIYEQPEGFYIYCAPGSARAWGFAKKALEFCELTQDGEDEGMLRLARLPTPAEGDVIRAKLGIRKKKLMSEEALNSLRAAGVKGAFQPSGSKDR